jgi:hypothetical protein
MKTNPNRLSPYFLRLSHLYESDHGLFGEEEFHRLMDLEAKRGQRSGMVSLLLLLDLNGFQGKREGDRVIKDVASALFASTREIDAIGWHRYPTTLGILVTDVTATLDSLGSKRDAILGRLRVNLATIIGSSDLARVGFSFHAVPLLPGSADFSVKHTRSIVEGDPCLSNLGGR